MGKIDVSALESAKVISGPRTLFSGAFILEFLEPPPPLKATYAFQIRPRATLILGLLESNLIIVSSCAHLHFAQSETFFVVQGKVGTTDGYEAQDRMWTSANTPQEIVPWRPHTFWPCGEEDVEDTVLYVWAHPDSVSSPMDRLFFENLLQYVSDIHEKKAKMDMIQIMVTQHASDTAMVMFPRAFWLGPLRWWVPWKLQATVAAVGRLMGYRALMERYTEKEEWETYLHAKRA
ncbi:hypothetical protein BDV95DRAFT_490900 [Massariosphaeria phaeospora]|uniref:Uncharacterized protein n=1 Tax=Massariosphaeria phaeospora TaxID=100035 RepID=A0A7C8I8E6_9PLEO|nr:hypothetical protein BDV95DRAFT_490900 [Massariosphaeria phaeospora]